MSYPTHIIKGSEQAALIRSEIKERILKDKLNIQLCVILVGDDPASTLYVRNKQKACAEVGIKSKLVHLSGEISEKDLLKHIDRLNHDPDIHGILIQLPLPKHIDSFTIISALNPAKDVDGLHPTNMGLLMQSRPHFLPCTPQGCIHLIKSVDPQLAGKHAVILGRSLIVGKPLAQMLLAENCTVTQIHSKSQNIAPLCQQADILVAAIGQPHFVKGSWIKLGAIVIDVGINRSDTGLQGDVEFNRAQGIARAITPVPGGVGPMTITYLLKNTLEAFLKA